jgi:hypothetical protein
VSSRSCEFENDDLAYAPHVNPHPNAARDGFIVSAETGVHVQLRLARFIRENRSHAAGFVHALKQGHHGLGRVDVSVSGADDDAAVVFRAAYEEAKRAFDFVFRCEGFEHVWQVVAIVKSEDENPSEFSFCEIHAEFLLTLE